MSKTTNMTTEAKHLLSLAASFAVNAADDRESLSEFSAGSRLSPPVMIESEIARMDPQTTHSINQVLLSIYCGHYLNAVTRLTKIGNVTVTSLLDPVSGGGNVNSADLVRDYYGMETIEPPAAPWESDNMDLTVDYSMEAIQDISKPSSLAVGKQLEVPLVAEGVEVKVPVTVTLVPKVLDDDFMVKVLEAFVGRDNSYIGRWHRWRAGEIKSFADYAFGLDLVEEDKKFRLDDKDGIYDLAKSRQEKGLLSSFISGKKQMNIASTMIVMTNRTAERMEAAMRGSFRSPRTRQEFFKHTGSMLLCVVDMNKERVRIYQRGIKDHGIYTYDDLAPAATNPGATDINAIVRAYKLGDAFSM